MTEAHDDVIRLRLDTGRAVESFLAQLADQAAAGESQAPSDPAATAVWRQLAPFRLVEYAYVDPRLGPAITGAYVGFPDGRLYDVEADIPDHVVTALVRLLPLPPLYVYLPLARPAPLEAIESFLDALSAHLGQPLIAALRPGSGPVVARLFDAEATRAATAESGRHFGHAALFAQITAQTCRPDGRAYASLTHDFTRRVIEFPSVEARDAFIAWTQAVCDRAFACGGEAGFPEAMRPAEIARIPEPEAQVARLAPPSAASLKTIEAMRAAWTDLYRTLEHQG